MRYLKYTLNGDTYVAGQLSQRFCDVSYWNKGNLVISLELDAARRSSV
jgi:hypothetical protein